MFERSKEELIDRIIEQMEECDKRNMNIMECYKKAVRFAIEDFTVVEETNINYCQSCGKDFVSGDLVYYAIIDNNIVCQQCAKVHSQKELRVVK